MVERVDMFRHAEGSLVAFMLRADTLKRWPLMYSNQSESVAVHTYNVAIISHRIGVYAKLMGKGVDPNYLAVLALFHESAEMGGVADLPGPLKRATPEMYKAIKDIEGRVERSMLDSMTDPDVKAEYSDLVVQSDVPVLEKALVKAADEIQMLIKCSREVAQGNAEFATALKKQRVVVENWSSDYPEVARFMREDFPCCLMTLDYLQS